MKKNILLILFLLFLPIVFSEHTVEEMGFGKCPFGEYPFGNCTRTVPHPEPSLGGGGAEPVLPPIFDIPSGVPASNYTEDYVCNKAYLFIQQHTNNNILFYTYEDIINFTREISLETSTTISSSTFYEYIAYFSFYCQNYTQSPIISIPLQNISNQSQFLEYYFPFSFSFNSSKGNNSISKFASATLKIFFTYEIDEFNNVNYKGFRYVTWGVLFTTILIYFIFIEVLKIHIKIKKTIIIVWNYFKKRAS